VTDGLSPRRALGLLAIVVLAWGTNWPVTKLIVRDVSPLWSTAMRSWIAALALAPLLWAQNSFVIPRRGDLPVVFCTALLHMVAFSALVATGLQFVPAGRAIVLGYTTPIWVAFGARIFLAEHVTKWRAIGIAFGLAGLAVIFNPGSLDWGDRNALLGGGLIIIAAFCWAANIVYIRAHKWISSPFQLVFWQVLLAGCVLSTIAFLKEGVPHIVWSLRLAGLLLYTGLVCTALAYWAMSMVKQPAGRHHVARSARHARARHRQRGRGTQRAAGAVAVSGDGADHRRYHAGRRGRRPPGSSRRSRQTVTAWVAPTLRAQAPDATPVAKHPA
jgi:drug/metabolite transporter (DMT)-like permease